MCVSVVYIFLCGIALFFDYFFFTVYDTLHNFISNPTTNYSEFNNTDVLQTFRSNNWFNKISKSTVSFCNFKKITKKNNLYNFQIRKFAKPIGVFHGSVTIELVLLHILLINKIRDITHEDRNSNYFPIFLSHSVLVIKSVNVGLAKQNID